MTPASNGIELDAELTIGDKEETIETNVGNESYNQEAQNITNIGDVPVYIILLLVLMSGWAIPSPGEMGRGLLTFLRVLLPWAGRR
jgi:hypothetical protein